MRFIPATQSDYNKLSTGSRKSYSRTTSGAKYSAKERGLTAFTKQALEAVKMETGSDYRLAYSTK